MRVEFSARAVVCLAPMPPQSLDLTALENAINLGRPLTQVINAQVAIVDYGRLRLSIIQGQPSNQVQLEAPGSVNRDLLRRAASEIVRQATPFGLRGLGFNGFGRIECDNGESPIQDLLNAELIDQRLDAQVSRAGVKFVYPLNGSQATLDISPAPEEESIWLASINRHYSDPPDEEELARAVSWFAALDHELSSTVRRLISGRAEEAEDVA